VYDLTLSLKYHILILLALKINDENSSPSSLRRPFIQNSIQHARKHISKREQANQY
jgi:hypothetical protein